MDSQSLACPGVSGVEAEILDLSNLTAWEIRNKKPWSGELIPFGSYVEYLPPPTTHIDCPKAATKSVPGIFLGWAIQPGGKWSGDFQVISLEAIRACDLSNTWWPETIPVHRVKQLWTDPGLGSFSHLPNISSSSDVAWCLVCCSLPM